ncbi:MAG: SRPBCC domain-containing protein [Brachymonas sp.]
MTGAVQLHRVLTSTPEKIWRAFTQADAFARWLPPNGFVGRIEMLDAKVGGEWRGYFTNFTTGSEIHFGGKYVELKENEIIAYTARFDGANLPGEMTTRVLIKPANLGMGVGVEINITQSGAR